MIIGKNYYEESQKLFSTGDSELDDILEEVYYSGIEDGYDYAQREFAEKTTTREERKRLKRDIKEAGLSKNDRDFILARARMKKSTNEDVIKSYEGDEEASDRLIERDKKLAKGLTAGLGAVAGAEIGATAAGGKGALIGGAAGAGLGYIGGHFLGKNAEEEERRHGKDPRYKTENEIRADYSRVALGKMTPEEFKKKWGRGYGD